MGCFPDGGGSLLYVSAVTSAEAKQTAYSPTHSLTSNDQLLGVPPSLCRHKIYDKARL